MAVWIFILINFMDTDINYGFNQKWQGPGNGIILWVKFIHKSLYYYLFYIIFILIKNRYLA